MSCSVDNFEHLAIMYCHSNCHNNSSKCIKCYIFILLLQIIFKLIKL